MLFSLAFLTIGYNIKYRKAHNLIPIYNSLSKEKRNKVNMEGIATMAGNLCFFIGLSTLLLAFYINRITIALYIALVYGSIVYAIHKRVEYDKNIRKLDKSMTYQLIGLAISFVVVISFVFFS